MELKRHIEQWRGGDPEAMAYHMSEAAIMFAFKDAKHDILALHAENERLRSLLEKARDEFKGLPHSLGYEFTHLPEIEAALAETPNVELTGAAHHKQEQER